LQDNNAEMHYYLVNVKHQNKMSAKKFIHSLVFSIFSVLIFSCSSSNELSGVWVNKEKLHGKSYKSIFIIAQTLDVQAKQQIENELAAKANEKGYKVVKSIDVMPSTLYDTSLPSKKAVVEKVKEAGCDAVFVVTFLKKEESVRYTQGTTAYAPLTSYNAYGNFWGYYSNYYPIASTPGYYSHDKEYFIQSNLYDLETEALVVSVQSKVYNPSSIDKFSKLYSKEVFKQMQDEKLLKK
jgi:hypothetical protein